MPYFVLVAHQGKQILYNNIFNHELESDISQSENTALRDEALTARYYYHAHLLRTDYISCLNQLRHEFFISPNQVVKRLSMKTDMLKEMVAKRISPKDLKRAYPHYNWTVMRLD